MEVSSLADPGLWDAKCLVDGCDEGLEFVKGTSSPRIHLGVRPCSREENSTQRQCTHCTHTYITELREQTNLTHYGMRLQIRARKKFSLYDNYPVTLLVGRGWTVVVGSCVHATFFSIIRCILSFAPSQTPLVTLKHNSKREARKAFSQASHLKSM